MGPKPRSLRRFGLRGVACWVAVGIAGAVLGAALVLGACSASPATVGSSSPGLDSLIIFHTNDTHAHLMPFKNERGELVGGAAARAALLERERFLAPHSLTLDGGDVFQGTAFFNLFHGTPDYRAMTMMGYDAGALGNHDLDNGPVRWLDVVGREGMPVLSGNVFGNAESLWARLENAPNNVVADCRRGARWIGDGRVPDSTRLSFLTRPGIMLDPVVRVGLFGLTTPEVVTIVSPRPNGGVAVGDPATAAKTLIPFLKRQGANWIICLSHLGLEADKELARRVSGIDVIVGGHSHTKLAKPILIPNGTPNGYHGTVIVQAGAYGEYLGRLAIYLDKGRPVGYSGRLIPVRPADGEDPDVVALLKPYADSIGGSMSQVVFHSPARVPSSGAREGETPLGNFVADAMREAVRRGHRLHQFGRDPIALPPRRRDRRRRLFHAPLREQHRRGSHARMAGARAVRHRGAPDREGRILASVRHFVCDQRPALGERSAWAES